MGKTYILDTNVILHDPSAINGYPGCHVILPIEVIKQVDTFKRDLNELGRNARETSRILDRLRTKGKLTEKIELENGGTIQVIINHKKTPEVVRNLSDMSSDRGILALGYSLKQDNGDDVIIVSKSLNLRLKADALGLKAEDFEKDLFLEIFDYKGFQEIKITTEELQEFQKIGSLVINKEIIKLRPNEYILLDDGNDSLLGRVATHTQNTVVPLEYQNEDVVGLQPLNSEQTFVLDALLDDRIKLVTLLGKAGTGKTLLAVAAGLKKVLRDCVYNKVLVARPVIPMGKDIGFLPGSIDEKMRPWMQPIYDSLELISSFDRQGRKPVLPANLLEIDELSVEPLTFIRGRSIPHQYMIIDEAQNLTPLEIKTIVTRVGKNSKIILTGDPDQIDHPYLDSMSNGLAYVVGKFRNNELSAHIQMQHGARSRLAAAAVDLL